MTVKHLLTAAAIAALPVAALATGPEAGNSGATTAATQGGTVTGLNQVLGDWTPQGLGGATVVPPGQGFIDFFVGSFTPGERVIFTLSGETGANLAFGED